MRREGQFQAEGTDLLEPVLYIASDGGSNEIFINRRGLLHDIPIVSGVFISGDDGDLILQGYLGIRHKQGRGQGVGFPALGTFDSADG